MKNYVELLNEENMCKEHYNVYKDREIGFAQIGKNITKELVIFV